MNAIAEIQTVREAAARVGAAILEMGVGPDGQPRGRIRCRDGWHAAKLLVALADADRRRSAWVKSAAADIRARTSTARSDWAFVALAHSTVQSRIRFARECGEIFAGPAFTWRARVGDCDDHARLLYAILAAGGVRVRLAFLYREWSEGPAHVCVQAFYDGAWHWCETTVRAELGEEPYDAAMRLGVVQSRSDIAKQVTTMSESDLPPVPAGFDSRTTPAQLERDTKALQELGYLCDASGIDVPDDPRFRVAVQALQRARGLKDDGLIGPKTRTEIGALVPWYAQRTIGDVTGLTSYLSDQFFADVAAMARDFQAEGATATAEDFLAVWLSESGCDPRTPGHSPFDQPSHGAFGGLNQMDATARKNVGFTGTLQDWLALPDVEQLAFVRKFYEVDVRAFCGGSFACLTDLGALYLINFLPAFMPHAGDPSFVLVRADNDTHGWYRDNAGLDVGRKGWIEVGDMAKVANGAKARNPKKWAELQERLSSAGGSGGSGGSAGVSVGGIVFLGAAVAGLAYALTRS